MTFIADAYRRFHRLLALGEHRLSVGDCACAAALAQIAAYYAFPANVGLFASPRLESLLLELGRRIPPVVDAHNTCRAGARRVLHVLSYAKPIGGDSRFAWRWIGLDAESCHSVAITSQSEVAHLYDIPQTLRDAVSRSGGFVRALGTPRSRPLDQARELRALCQQADTVVLHTYPYDAIPVMALASGCGAVKTVYVNHSDHTFWLGGSVAHAIAHLRAQSADFLQQRRGLDAHKSFLLPIPLDEAPPNTEREQAKRTLGYADDTTVLLTIASPFKYSAPGQLGFLDVVEPVMSRFPNTVLLAVGPSNERRWREAHDRTHGRITALGRRWDNDVLCAAADIYLDSIPFSSITSLLEAGLHGTPLVGLRPATADLGLLGPGAPGLERSMCLAPDPDTYQQTLARLIIDQDLRHRTGATVRENVSRWHGAPGWRLALEDMYSGLDRLGAAERALRDTQDHFRDCALANALVQLFSSVQPPARSRQLIAQYVGALPYATRASMSWELYRRGFGLCVSNLLPSVAAVPIRSTGRFAKRLLRAS